MLSCNLGNYLIKRQSERYIIIMIIIMIIIIIIITIIIIIIMIILDKQKHPITMITKLLSARYYVSLMDFAQNLIFITSYIIYILSYQ